MEYFFIDISTLFCEFHVEVANKKLQTSIHREYGDNMGTIS
jgi:hypothetical protein